MGDKELMSMREGLKKKPVGKKSSRQPYHIFKKQFIDRFQAEICESDYWKNDIIESYGFVWVRWNAGMTEDEIIKDLRVYLANKEINDRIGTFSVKILGDRIRISCRGKGKDIAWQRIIMGRLNPYYRLMISSSVNLSFDLDLNPAEQELLNADITAKRLQPHSEERGEDI